MTAARQHILDRLAQTGRANQAKGAVSDGVPGGATENAPGGVRPAPPVPSRGHDQDHDSRIRRFMDEAALAGSDVLRSPSLSAVPETLARYLAGKGSGFRPRVSDDPLLKNMPWPEDILCGPTEPADRAAVSVALAAVAETGTVVLSSAPENPALYAFIPAIHVAVVPESRVVGHYEQVWALLRQQGNGQANRQTIMPRSLNFITGPSRTADIEQTLLMGAHGPHSQAVILVGEKAGKT